ncbi:MAG TPA: hypothetical protein VK081_12910, partial [Planctomycetota bacterium]|nr:hypothetical protein [Planctomycetota bacterium]
TSEESIAMMMTRGNTPALEKGQHYRLVLGEDGEWTCTAAAGDVGLLTLRARPGLLMESFAEQVEQIRQLSEMSATASNPEVDTAFVTKLVDGMFSFPAQIDVFTLTVHGDQTKGYDAHAEITPVAGGWLAGLVTRVQPTGKGAPTLPEGALTMAFDCAPAAFEPLVDNLIDFVLSMAPAEQRDALRATIADSRDLFDGTGAFTFQDRRGTVVYGCDGAKAAAKLASEDWTKLQEAILTTHGGPTETTREKVGDLDVLRVSGTIDDNPMFPDGKLESATFVVGDMLVSAINTDDEALRTLAARAKEGKRAALPGGALLTFRMDFAQLVALSGNADLDPGDMPKAVACRIGKKQGSPVLTMDTRVEF